MAGSAERSTRWAAYSHVAAQHSASSRSLRRRGTLPPVRCVTRHLRALISTRRALLAISHTLEDIMTTQAELADALDALTQTVTKIGLETSATLDKVAELEAAISAGGTVSAEVQTALDALRAQIKTVDDLVPDSTP